jgi:hypothetical protein
MGAGDPEEMVVDRRRLAVIGRALCTMQIQIDPLNGGQSELQLLQKRDKWLSHTVKCTLLLRQAHQFSIWQMVRKLRIDGI